MKIKLNLLLAVAFISLFCTNIIAQTNSSDVWLSSTFKYEVLKNLDAKVEFGHRRENFYASRLYGDVILKYNFNKHAKLALGWRHAAEGDPQEIDAISDRFHADFSGKQKMDDFSFNYRVRFQRKFKNLQTDSKGLLPNNSIRTRLLTAYKLNKDWSFDAGIEFFFQLSNSEPIYTDKFRIIAGAEYRINKSQNIAIHYIRQQEVQVPNPHASHILSIDYSVDVKRMIKKLRKKNKKNDSGK